MNKPTIVIHIDNCDFEGIELPPPQTILQKWEDYYSPKFKDFNVVCIRNSEHIEVVKT
jgi:hypothetical protein